MVRAASLVPAGLFCGVPFAAETADAEGFDERPRPIAVALSAGAYVLPPSGSFPREASAEIVVADRFAIGAKTLFFESDPLLAVAIGTRRSRPSATYFALAWMPASRSDGFGWNRRTRLRASASQQPNPPLRGGRSSRRPPGRPP